MLFPSMLWRLVGCPFILLLGFVRAAKLVDVPFLEVSIGVPDVVPTGELINAFAVVQNRYKKELGVIVEGSILAADDASLITVEKTFDDRPDEIVNPVDGAPLGSGKPHNITDRPNVPDLATQGRIARLKPGETRKVKLPFSQWFNFNATGPGNYTVVPSFEDMDTILLDGSGALTKVPAHSDYVQFTIRTAKWTQIDLESLDSSHEKARANGATRPTPAKEATAPEEPEEHQRWSSTDPETWAKTRGCDFPKQVTIGREKEETMLMVSSAISYLEGFVQNGIAGPDPLYEMWFGNQTEGNVKEVLGNFETIQRNLEATIYDCNCPISDNFYYKAKRPSSKLRHIVHLCERFWKADSCLKPSKQDHLLLLSMAAPNTTTLTGHVQSFHDPAPVKRLAKRNPRRAIHNRASYRFFASTFSTCYQRRPHLFHPSSPVAPPPPKPPVFEDSLPKNDEAPGNSGDMYKTEDQLSAAEYRRVMEELGLL